MVVSLASVSEMQKTRGVTASGLLHFTDTGHYTTTISARPASRRSASAAPSAGRRTSPAPPASASLPASRMSTFASISASTVGRRQLIDLSRERPPARLRPPRSSPAGSSRCRCPANASTYFHGGSSGFFVPVLAKIISCFSVSPLSAQNSLVQPPDALGVHDADLPLRRRRQVGHVLLGVHVQPADEDAVDGLHVRPCRRAAGCPRQQASRAAMYCRSLKISVTLTRTPAATSSSSAAEPARRGRHLDHPVLVPGRPLLAELDVLRRPLGRGHVAGRVFEQRVELEADPAVVAAWSRPRPARTRPARPAPACRSWPRRWPRRRGPASTNALMSASNRPVLSRSEMMIGLDVAPVAPSARLRGDLVGVDGVEPELGAGRRRGIAAGSWRVSGREGSAG